MRYKIQLEKTKEGYSVSCPELPGCWSQGKTKKETLKNIKDAIKMYLETKETLKPADESFVQGWKEAMSNELLPIELVFETESEI